MAYNEVIATTTSFDNLGNAQGYTVKITTYPTDLFVLITITLVVFFVIKKGIQALR